MVSKSRMVLASPGPLLTPPPSSSPPKTPHPSHSAQTRSQNEEKNPRILQEQIKGIIIIVNLPAESTGLFSEWTWRVIIDPVWSFNL